MQKYKIGNVKVEELAPGLVRLKAPWWFQSRNLEKALTEGVKLHWKIKFILPFDRGGFPKHLLVFLEN